MFKNPQEQPRTFLSSIEFRRKPDRGSYAHVRPAVFSTFFGPQTLAVRARDRNVKEQMAIENAPARMKFQKLAKSCPGIMPHEHLDEHTSLMPWATCGRLGNLLVNRGQFRCIALQLLTILDCLQKAGIAHGDISSRNLLIYRGHLALIDPDTCRVTERASYYYPGNFQTLAYEQASDWVDFYLSAGPRDRYLTTVNLAALDIWAAGMVLLYLALPSDHPLIEKANALQDILQSIHDSDLRVAEGVTKANDAASNYKKLYQEFRRALEKYLHEDVTGDNNIKSLLGGLLIHDPGQRLESFKSALSAKLFTGMNRQFVFSGNHLLGIKTRIAGNETVTELESRISRLKFFQNDAPYINLSVQRDESSRIRRAESFQARMIKELIGRLQCSLRLKRFQHRLQVIDNVLDDKPKAIGIVWDELRCKVQEPKALNSQFDALADGVMQSCMEQTIPAKMVRSLGFYATLNDNASLATEIAYPFVVPSAPTGLCQSRQDDEIQATLNQFSPKAFTTFVAMIAILVRKLDEGTKPELICHVLGWILAAQQDYEYRTTMALNPTPHRI